MIFRNKHYFIGTSRKIYVLDKEKQRKSIFEPQRTIKDFEIFENGMVIVTEDNLYRYDVNVDSIDKESESKLFSGTKNNIIGVHVMDNKAYLVTSDSVYKLETIEKYVSRPVGNLT